MLFCQTSAGWAANLYSLKGTAVFQSASDIKDDLTQCCSHRNFNKAGVLDRTG